MVADSDSDSGKVVYSGAWNGGYWSRLLWQLGYVILTQLEERSSTSAGTIDPAFS